MSKKNKGIGGFSPIILMLGILVLYWFVFGMSASKNMMTYGEFTKALKEEQIESVIIEQNKAVPTGQLEIRFKDADVDDQYLNVSDVNEAQELLENAGVEKIKVLAVPEENIFLTTWLPTILMTVVIVGLFLMMNRQGGANAKAMNFGRNRAKMSNPSDKQITFANVAGLSEEKEEFEEIVDFLKSPKKYIQVGA